jgi:hypothetical protein
MLVRFQRLLVLGEAVAQTVKMGSGGRLGV